MSALIIKSLSTFAAGAVLMLLLSFTIYRQSYYYKKAKAEANGAAAKPGILSRLVTLMFLLAMIFFFVLFDLWVASDGPYTFVLLVALNLVLVAFLSAFDALFIDLFLLVIWRPTVLRLPPGQPTRESMVHHIKRQFTAGWLFKVPIALTAAAVSSLLGAGSS